MPTPQTSGAAPPYVPLQIVACKRQGEYLQIKTGMCRLWAVRKGFQYLKASFLSGLCWSLVDLCCLRDQTRLSYDTRLHWKIQSASPLQAMVTRAQFESFVSSRRFNAACPPQSLIERYMAVQLSMERINFNNVGSFDYEIAAGRPGRHVTRHYSWTTLKLGLDMMLAGYVVVPGYGTATL